MKCLTNKWREGAMLLSFLLISCLAGIFTACDDIEDEYITDTQLSILQGNRTSLNYLLKNSTYGTAPGTYPEAGKDILNAAIAEFISNPPYVTQQAMEELPAEYRHEPELALEAGDDGMDFMRRFMPALKEHLTENGVAIVEIGDGREAFEAIWPELPVTWLSTEEEEDMVFAVRAEDLQHL